MNQEKLLGAIKLMEHLLELHRKQDENIHELTGVIMGKAQRTLEGLSNSEVLLYPCIEPMSAMFLRRKIKGKRVTDIVMVDNRQMYVGFVNLALEQKG